MYQISLSLLLFLFCLRVLGQFLVAFWHVTFLPPMSEWQSGLLPYPMLLFFQVAIIFTFAFVCRDFFRQSGFFYSYKQLLGRPLAAFAKVYLLANCVRLLFWQAFVPHHIWFAGMIPIVFHFILAAFLYIVARHHLAMVKVRFNVDF